MTDRDVFMADAKSAAELLIAVLLDRTLTEDQRHSICEAWNADVHRNKKRRQITTKEKQ